MATINLDRQNDRVQAWGQKANSAFKGAALSLRIIHRADSPSKSASLPKIKDRYRFRSGVIEVVSFRFPRELIWTHKGAGKGVGGVQGSTWIGPDGNRKRTNPRSFGKIGSYGSRRPKPFFNQVLDGPSGMDELATIVAEETGDAIIGNLLIK